MHLPFDKLIACAWVGAFAALLAGCSSAPPRDAALQPEQASPRSAPDSTTAPRAFTREAIVAAHPLAAEAGAQLLREGGSAIDAALAAQWVLGLVEPQSSGLGGGGFLLHWDGQRVQAYDGRETAPAAADTRLFLDATGTPLGFEAAAVGGRSVGVPGIVRMLELAHAAHGRRPWARSFDAAIALAERGFAIGPRLHALLQDDAALRRDPVARALYYQADGSARPVGSVVRNPEYAAVLRRLATEGSRALHEGEVARAIVDAVRSHPGNPGRLTLDDLSGYRALEREALCHDWRRWRVCGMPPPSSGALVVAQLLSLLDRANAADADGARWAVGQPTAPFVHRYAEAARLAYADREQYVADPAFVAAPNGGWAALLGADYLAQRARLIGPRSMRQAPHGSPGGAPLATQDAAANDTELPATTHLSVVDAEGHAVALTSSIEAQFGSRVMVQHAAGGAALSGGFLLNNQLTDFSFAPTTPAGGQPAPNRVEAGKRPRSSMSPTLVFERLDGGALRLVMVAGSPGGVPIPLYVAQSVWAVLAEGIAPQAAAGLPHFGAINGPTTVLEEGGFDPALRAALEARGHTVRELPLTSGTHLLVRDGERWQAGVDPRREGAAAGR